MMKANTKISTFMTSLVSKAVQLSTVSLFVLFQTVGSATPVDATECDLYLKSAPPQVYEKVVSELVSYSLRFGGGTNKLEAKKAGRDLIYPISFEEITAAGAEGSIVRIYFALRSGSDRIFVAAVFNTAMGDDVDRGLVGLVGSSRSWSEPHSWVNPKYTGPATREFKFKAKEESDPEADLSNTPGSKVTQDIVGGEL